ncbi:hypothetical protein HYT04_02920 [Candidatus Kaiserbacteria bacterium]|nr:hypothetical protein [Candidatus Kaiserbacteria bacterium]
MERLKKISNAIFYIVFWWYAAWERYKESQVISEEPGGIHEDDWVDLFFAVAGGLLLAMTSFFIPFSAESGLLDLPIAVVILLFYMVLGVIWSAVVSYQFLFGRFDRELEKDLAKSPD